MVRFERDRLVIEIATTSPHEEWLNIHEAICNIARFVNQDTIMNDSFASVIDLLDELMLDRKTAEKMLEPC